MRLIWLTIEIHQSRGECEGLDSVPFCMSVSILHKRHDMYHEVSFISLLFVACLLLIPLLDLIKDNVVLSAWRYCYKLSSRFW